MHDNNHDKTQEVPMSGNQWQSDTARWTSNAYQVQFDTVQYLQSNEDDESFRMSAWGMSHRLRLLLGDYRDDEIRSATEWLANHQNMIVADMLEDMALHSFRQGETMPPLHTLFIAVETDLFLPRGLKINVSCITNMVPDDDSDDSVDKFVAVLDPSEAHLYVMERSESYTPPRTQYLH
ncbi:MAG: hypothetical protein KC546_15975 [Anaerolineae bacterium]|nr:hypothetical protein [Anaerolineae bacterium]MCA9889879.1 hypothetical protein [Anaerolineae bacterium]